MTFGWEFAAVLTLLAFLAWVTEPDPDVDWKSPWMERFRKMQSWFRF